LNFFKNLLLQNQEAKINKTWYKLSLGDENIIGQVLFKWEIIKIGRGHSKIFLSRTIVPILTRHGTNHLCVKRIQVIPNEGHSPFPRGDNSKRVKIH
jgi:hypothetical protein